MSGRPKKKSVKREREEQEGQGDVVVVRHFLTYQEGNSDKFYEIKTKANDVLCRYGRSGSAGVTTVKSFDDKDAVEKHISKLLNEKLKKGYLQQDVPDEEQDVCEEKTRQPPAKKKKGNETTPDDNEQTEEGGDKSSVMEKDANDQGEKKERNDDDITIPDPIAVSLIKDKRKKDCRKNISFKVATSSITGEPFAAHLILPSTSSGGTDKFYNISLIEFGIGAVPDCYYMFSRWGNEGGEAYTELSSSLATLPLAIESFELRFKLKTANRWSERSKFVPKSFHFRLGRAGHCRELVSIAPPMYTAPHTIPEVSSTQRRVGLLQKTTKKNPPPSSVAGVMGNKMGDGKVVRKIYLECREGSSDKFYELKHTDDGVVVIRYGRRLAAGATSEKKFSSNDEAVAFVDKTATVKRRKGYHDAAPEGDDTDVQPSLATVISNVEASGDLATDLENGLKVFVQGGSKLPYTLKKFNGGYSCTCRGWVGQIRIKGVQAASCKHLKQVRGEEAEAIRCQASAGVVSNPSSKGNKNTSITSRISLAQKWKPSIDPTGYVMSEKLDGMRAYWCGEKLWTRSGLPIVTPQWFIEGFPSDVELDGELFLGRQMFDECMSITRRTDASNEWQRIKYVVFDAPKVGGGILERLEAAKSVLSDCGNEYAVIHPHSICTGVDHLLEELAATEQGGGEGMMLRRATAVHRGGRNTDLLKVKSFHDDEAIVVDYEEGKGKYSGMVGSLVCRSRQGAAFKVGSGLNDSQRSYQSKSLPPVGSVITFQYFELTKDGIPRFPTFLRIRPDVDPAEFK